MTANKIIPFKKKFLSALLFLTAAFSILTAIDSSGTISYFLTLSPYTLKQNYYFQLITYIFLLPYPSVSTGFILRLAVNLYIFFFCASLIINHKNSLQLFCYLLLLTLFSAAAALFLMNFKPFFLFGLNILICSVAAAWLMAAGNVRFYAPIFRRSLQAKWLVFNLILIRLLYNIFSEDYFTAVLDLSGVLFTYFYALIIWGRRSPFANLAGFEEPLTRLFPHKK